ncbi:MAG: SMC-Scp complex subunit ScpB [Fuerstiella sp.]
MSEPIDDTVAKDAVDDIELAYREALKSIDEAEQQVGSALMELADDGDGDEESAETAFTSIGNALADDLAADDETGAVIPTLSEDAPRVSPRAVIEGALFVGGDVALTARRLASLIGQETDTRLAVRLIDQLNEDYAAENRPYEIRLHEGGFRLEIREHLGNIKARVFGLGPREVRLSPESLEVLAFVAYNQPVTTEDLAEIGQSRVQTLIRQLIRLQLVEVERTGKRRSDIVYRTGNRFLDLFGLNDLQDLPQADVFSFK